MSQVILKLAEGNKLNAQSNKNLIEIGTDKYDFNDLAKIYQTNDFDSFYLDQGFNEKDLPELRNYGKQYLEAFKNGKIKRNIDGSYTVSDPTLFTDNENPVKKTLFGKIKGDKKRVVLGYFDNLINQLSPYTESKEEVKVTPTESKLTTTETKKTPFEYGYRKYLEKNIFKDDNKSDIEKDIWFNTEDKWKIATKAFNDYIQSLDGDYDFSNTSFSNKDEYIKVLNQLKSSIENKDLEAFKQALYDAGEADTFGYFITPEEYKLSKMTPEEQQKYLVQKQTNSQTQNQNNIIDTKKVENQILDEANKLGDEVTINFKNLIPRYESWINTIKPAIKNENTYLSLIPPHLQNVWRARNLVKTWYKDWYNYLTEPVVSDKQGGTIKAQTGVKFPITNTTKNPIYNRENNLLKSLEVESYLKSLTPDNYMQFNGYEDLYDKNYETTYGKGSLSQWGTHNTSKLDSNPMVKHMQYVWNSRGLNNPIYKGFTGVGVSGDNPQGQGQDSAMGNMTIERTLGHLTDDQARYLQTKLDPNLEFYKTNTGVYRIRPKQFHTSLTGKPIAINPANKPLSVQSNIGQESLTAKLSDPFNKVRSWTPSSENINDFRYLLTNILNNKIKYNPSVLTTDAPQLSARVQYNLPLESFYNRQADRIRRLSSKTATADQDKNRAFNLDTEMTAQGVEDKGKLANMDTYLQTSKTAQDINNQNILYRVENANQNKARMIAVQEAKDAFERTKQLKKQQNLVNWLYGKQQRLYNIEQQNKAIESEMQQFKWQQDWNNMQEPFKKELEQASLAYNKENSNNSNAPAFETTDTYKKIMERFSLAQSNLYKKIMKEKADWQKQNLTLFKSGGSFLEKKVLQDAREYNKFLLNNNREMNKLIRLSITENNKTIRGLSNYSAQLIRDSLKLK